MYVKEILMAIPLLVGAGTSVLRAAQTRAGKLVLNHIMGQIANGTIGNLIPGAGNSGGGGGTPPPKKRGIIGSVAPYLGQALGGIIQTAGNTAATGAAGAGATLGAFSEAGGNALSHIVPESKTQLELYGNTPMNALAGITSDLGKAAGVGFNAAGQTVGTGLKGVGDTIGGTIIDAANAVKLRQMFEDIATTQLAPSQAQLAGRVVSNQFGGRK
jgi:hypothetical protein